MLSRYSTLAEIAAETTRLQAEKAQLAQQAKIQTGNLLILSFWRRHPHVLVNEANERIIREFIGAREFTSALLDEWFPLFESRLAKVQTPRETVEYVAPEPRPEPLVPFSRRELLRMDAASLRELKNRSEDTHREINRILNQKETQ